MSLCRLWVLGNRRGGPKTAAHRAATADRSEITVQTFKVGTAEKKLYCPPRFAPSFLFFFVVFSLYFSCISLSTPRTTAPTIPHQQPDTTRPARARTHTQYFGNIRDETNQVPNTTPECRCDGMFEFRYAAFQCENFSLSHSAAFAGAAATAENGTAGCPIEVPTTHHKIVGPQ